VQSEWFGTVLGSWAGIYLTHLHAKGACRLSEG
jgi:hypothetical protein